MASAIPCTFSRAMAFRASTRAFVPQLQHATFATKQTRSLHPTITCLYSRAAVSPVQKQHPTPTTTALLQARYASTSTPPPPPPSSTSATTTTTTKDTPTSLTYNDFFLLRRQRRTLNLIASLTTSVSAIALTMPVLVSYEIDRVGAQVTGMDPMFVIGGSLLATGAVGWLMGPFLGTAVFGVWKRGVVGEFGRKEKTFYGHIKRYRADPASSSPYNPAPDYYGEKIGSVADYRRWLKDQRAFIRKKTKNMI